MATFLDREPITMKLARYDQIEAEIKRDFAAASRSLANEMGLVARRYYFWLGADAEGVRE